MSLSKDAERPAEMLLLAPRGSQAASGCRTPKPRRNTRADCNQHNPERRGGVVLQDYLNHMERALHYVTADRAAAILVTSGRRASVERRA